MHLHDENVIVQEAHTLTIPRPLLSIPQTEEVYMAYLRGVPMHGRHTLIESVVAARLGAIDSAHNECRTMSEVLESVRHMLSA